VLAGLIASQIVRKDNIFNGTILGVYIHGLIGNLIEESYEEGETATDILENIKNAIRYYKESYEKIKEEFYEGK